ncbi:flagellar assembly protein FliH [Phenylobacterium sp.]|jgi:flagellar assembly protein FliH|uniref:flagellar assembly protein FliH n=1 Tax=Phenylobacterium sp. TaxID=1871053 RepID=UPI0037833F93
MSELQKFSFDTEFDAGGGVAFQAPRPKTSYSPDEVEQIRREAYADGEKAGLQSVNAAQARAMAEVAAQCRQAMPKLAEVAHDHRIGSAQLALACGRAIADAALDRFPEAPLQAALDALAREIESAPRLVIQVGGDMAAYVEERLGNTVSAVGYPGQVTVRAEPGLNRHAFTLDFGDGAAAFDPEAAQTRVAAALEAALAAEGLHAEPLIPGTEG